MSSPAHLAATKAYIEKKNNDNIESLFVNQSKSAANSRFLLFKPLLVFALMILVCQLPLFIIVSLMNAIDFIGVSSTQVQYTSGEARNDLFDSIACVCSNNAHDLIRASPTVGVCIDEGTDINEEKTLIVYARIFNYETKRFEEVFAGILNLNGDYSAKNIALTLIAFLLNEVKVTVRQVIGFASDGASVMIGLCIYLCFWIYVLILEKCT